jgi:hypothetical protein
MIQKNKKSPHLGSFAEREGFEPSVPFPVRQFSKLILSASQAPLRFTLCYYPFFRDCKYSNSCIPSKKKIIF